MVAYGITAAFFDAVVKRAVDAGLASDEHFSVDGMLIDSYASIKSFRPIQELGQSTGGKEQTKDNDEDNNSFKPRNPEVDFRGQKRSNQTHRSTTDPEARLYRKGNGQPARLCHMGHALCENRHGLIMGVAVTKADGTAEQEATLTMLDDLHRRQGIRPKTLGADRGYDSGPWMIALEERGITPHAAMRSGVIGGEKGTSRLFKKNRPNIEARERMAERIKQAEYSVSQRCRKKIEEGFGWCKTVAGLYRTRLVGRWKIVQQLTVAAAAYNLVRMRSLLAANPPPSPKPTAVAAR